MKTISIEMTGARLYVEHAGAGAAVVFLHAGVADRRMWGPQIAALMGSHHAIAYDRRGFGSTTAQNVPFGHVSDLGAVLDHFDIDAAILVGGSQGGRVAIDFAIAFPQRISALLLVAPAISGAPIPTSFSPAIAALLNELEAAETAGDVERINALEARLWLDGPAAPAGRVGGPVRDLFLDMNEIALRSPALTKETEPPSVYGRLSELTIPVWVTWGELDFPHIKDRCHHLLDAIPHAHGVEIAGTAHLPNLERPARFNRILRRFLDRASQ